MKNIIIILTTVETVLYTCMLFFLSPDIGALPMSLKILSVCIAAFGYLCLGILWIKLWKMNDNLSA